MINYYHGESLRQALITVVELLQDFCFIFTSLLYYLLLFLTYGIYPTEVFLMHALSTIPRVADKCEPI